VIADATGRASVALPWTRLSRGWSGSGTTRRDNVVTSCPRSSARRVTSRPIPADAPITAIFINSPQIPTLSLAPFQHNRTAGDISIALFSIDSPARSRAQRTGSLPSTNRGRSVRPIFKAPSAEPLQLMQGKIRHRNGAGSRKNDHGHRDFRQKPYRLVPCLHGRRPPALISVRSRVVLGYNTPAQQRTYRSIGDITP
jgi:hypothetical protein